MRERSLMTMFCAALLIATASAAQQINPPRSGQLGSLQQGRVSSAYGMPPLSFEANQGQTSAQAKFIARGRGYSAFLTTGGMVLSIRPSKVVNSQPTDTSATSLQISGQPQRPILQFNLLGATQNPTATGEGEQPGRVNYFIGKDPKRWHRNVPTYARVRYKDVYPGIDLVYYGSQRQLEYDFEVSAAANPNLIQFEIKGADHMQLGGNGDLVLTLNGGELHFRSPVLYQESNGQRFAVDGGYVVKDATHIGFRLAHYDPSKPLVIDPVLVYSTYLGGSGDDEPHGIAIDGAGSIYVAGDTDSSDFPGTSAGSLDFGLPHAFVAKLDTTGSQLVYADYLGGDCGDWGAALAVDSGSEVYLTGNTCSDDFPTVTPYQSSQTGTRNGFVSKISADGSQLVYSTYLGGNSWDAPASIALDSSGDVLVAGITSSTNFPVANAFQSTMSANQGGVFGNYGFLTEFNSDGSFLVYSTYFGGSSMVIQSCSNGPCWFPPVNRITGLAEDANGNAYVTGYTNTYDFPVTQGAYSVTDTTPDNTLVGFVAKFNSSGGLDYSTYLYGSGGAQTDIEAIAVDGSGSAYVTGAATSDGTFPITSTSICDPGVSGLACSYTFVTKLDPTGSTLLYSTFLGPNNNASPQAIAIDGNNDAYILGMAWGCNSFAMVNGIESCGDLSTSDLLLVEIDPTGATELFATFLGGAENDEYPAGVVVDSAGNIFVGGETFSGDFPTTQGAFQGSLNGVSNAFLLKIAPGSAPAVSASPFLLQYASQQIGSSSPAATALLRNAGSSSLLISSITASGDFTETNDCGTTVPAAGSCTLSVTFSPTAAGSRSGSIIVQDNAAGSPHIINLSGDALGAVAVLTAASLGFAAQPVGSSSTAQGVTLTNAGNVALTVSDVQIAGDFVQNNNCPASLAANTSCVVNVTFTPIATGARSGSVTITDSAAGSPQAVNLVGVGTDFAFTSSQSGNAVIASGFASYQFTVSPVGGAFDSMIQLSCSATPSANCKVSPSAVSPNGSAVTATLTLSAAASVSQAGPVRPSPGRPIYAVWTPLQAIGMVGMILLGRRRRSSRPGVIVLLVLMTVGLMFMSGCGGGTGIKQPPQSGIAPGTYTITITGTSGALEHSLFLTLTVHH